MARRHQNRRPRNRHPTLNNGKVDEEAADANHRDRDNQTWDRRNHPRNNLQHHERRLGGQRRPISPDRDTDSDIKMENNVNMSYRDRRKHRESSSSPNLRAPIRRPPPPKPPKLPVQSCGDCQAIEIRNTLLGRTLSALSEAQQGAINLWAAPTWDLVSSVDDPELMDWQPESTIPVYIVTNLQEASCYPGMIREYNLSDEQRSQSGLRGKRADGLESDSGIGSSSEADEERCRM